MLNDLVYCSEIPRFHFYIKMLQQICSCCFDVNWPLIEYFWPKRRASSLVKTFVLLIAQLVDKTRFKRRAFIVSSSFETKDN